LPTEKHHMEVITTCWIFKYPEKKWEIFG